MTGHTLCILGCGNLGTAILKSLVRGSEDGNPANINRFIACLHSQASEQRLSAHFSQSNSAHKVRITRGENVKSVKYSDIVILGVDPADVEATLKEEGLSQALKGRLLISIAAGWSREKLEGILSSAKDSPNEKETVWVLRVLPNIAAQVSQSLTAIEEPHSNMPTRYMHIAESMFQQIGQTVRIAPRLMNATTAVAGSTPAFFAVICDAMIDAAIAVGVPRASAQAMIYQSMKGTAEMLQSGIHPGVLKDQGTSPEGCTIGGIMVLEEAGVRGHVGRALREAVTIARLMGSGRDDVHVNDTRW